jgi:type II secretory pathway component PulF
MSFAGISKRWYERDVFELIGWRNPAPAHLYPDGPRNPLGRWESLIMANSAARREAKGALFGELAEATRQGMPLDAALLHASQNVDESRKRRWRSNLPPGAESRHRPLDVLIAILMTVVGHLGYVFYGLMALRMTDIERISRLLALRLYRYVAAGYTLSDAMRRCSEDYDVSEVQMIEASEQWGALPDGLKRLSQFQISERQLTMMGTLALYPFWMGGLLLVVATFCMVFIIPKFKDIYDQLGAELPAPTTLLLNYAQFFSGSVAGLLVNLVWIGLLLFFILRGLLNGTRMTKLLVGLAVCLSVAGITAGAGMSLVDAMNSNHNNPDEGWYVMSVIGLVVLLTVLVVPYILSGIEKFVLRVERNSRPLLRFLPLAGRAVRVEQQARWLGALALGLSSGVTPDRALRSAGRICGGNIERKSFYAAELAAGGYAIGAACVRAGVLDTAANYRLQLLDGRPDYLDGLRSIAEDSSQYAYEWLQRSGRVAEIFMIVALGIVAAFFVIAMYLPLFNIVKIVGHEDERAQAPVVYNQEQDYGRARL